MIIILSRNFFLFGDQLGRMAGDELDLDRCV